MKSQKYQLQIPFESSDNTQDSSSAFGKKIERKPARKLFQSPKNIFNTSKRDSEVPLTAHKQQNMTSKQKSMTKSGIVVMQAIGKSMRYLSPNSSKSQNMLCNYFQQIKNCEQTTSIQDIEGLSFEDLQIPTRGRQKRKNLKEVPSKTKICSSITTKLQNPFFGSQNPKSVQNQINCTKQENRKLLMENQKLKYELNQLKSQNKSLQETVLSLSKAIERQQMSNIKGTNQIKILQQMLQSKQSIIKEMTNRQKSNSIMHQKAQFIQHLFNKMKNDYVSLKQSNNSLVLQNIKLSKKIRLINHQIQNDEFRFQCQRFNCQSPQKAHSNLRQFCSGQNDSKQCSNRDKLKKQANRKDLDIFSLSPE